jgi:hypothetical protein
MKQTLGTLLADTSLTFLVARYVGDSTVGHRLFKEDVTVDYKQNWKGKNGRLTKPVLNIHWETAATNLDEFLDISVRVPADMFFMSISLCSTNI